MFIENGQNRPATLGFEDIILFGKYAGKTVSSVLNKDPAYLMWAAKNVLGFCLSGEVLDKLVFDDDSLGYEWSDYNDFF